MNGHSSQCSSSGPQIPPRKRRRVDTTKSPSSNIPLDVFATEEMKEELVILRRKLSKAENSLQIKNNNEKLIKQKKKLMEKDLDITQSKLSKVQEEVNKLRIENFLLNAKPVHSTCGKPLTPLQMNVIQTQKTMEAAEQKIKELEQQLNLQKTELDDAKVMIKELNAKILSQEHVEPLPSTETHVQQLEEKLRAAEEKISALRADVEEKYALEEQLYCLQKKWDLQRDAGVQMSDELTSGGQDLQENDEEIGEMSEMTEIMIKVDPELLFFGEDSSDSFADDEGYDPGSSPGTECDLEGSPGAEYDPESSPGPEFDSSSSPGAEDDLEAQNEESPEDLEETKPQKDVRTIGKGSSLRPTDPKFFDIDWKKEYTRVEQQKWECRTCSHSLAAKIRIVDHVWNAHYGEKFECSFCDVQLKWRASELKHMKTKHPGLFNKRRVRTI